MNFFKDYKGEAKNDLGDRSSDEMLNFKTPKNEEDLFFESYSDGADEEALEKMMMEKKMVEKIELEENLIDEAEAHDLHEKPSGEPKFDLFSEREEKITLEQVSAPEEKASSEPEVSSSTETPVKADFPEVAMAGVPTPKREVFNMEEDLSMYDSGNKTVISEGTIIEGNIISDGSVEVQGIVDGDISCFGKITVSGAVNGKLSASEVFINTNNIVGGIVCKGLVNIGEGTVVIGNVTATSCVIAGAVKGDIDVSGPLTIDSTAVIKGNINSKGIQINNGAVIDGFCALPYAKVDIDSFFGEGTKH